MTAEQYLKILTVKSTIMRVLRWWVRPESGKSTLTKLAMCLYDVQEGTVLVYDKDVRAYSIHDLRVSLGVVSQNPFIFYGSVWDNIKIARPDAANKDIIHAMEIAHVHEFVNEMEQGWNTIVGDGGVKLLSGQIQRVAIARCFGKS